VSTIKTNPAKHNILSDFRVILDTPFHKSLRDSSRQTVARQYSASHYHLTGHKYTGDLGKKSHATQLGSGRVSH
jgi:hypothetical protein